jgi:hypothetical protein
MIIAYYKSTNASSRGWDIFTACVRNSPPLQMRIDVMGEGEASGSQAIAIDKCLAVASFTNISQVGAEYAIHGGVLVVVQIS